MFEDIRKFSALSSSLTTVLSSFPVENQSEPVGHLTGGLNYEDAMLAGRSQLMTEVSQSEFVFTADSQNTL
jgi:hypothetical protein